MERFEVFVRREGERVRRALVGFYGVEVGTEAAAEAMSIAWHRWPEISEMANSAGFLFRVGQSKARPMLRWHQRRGAFPAAESATTADQAALVDLFDALRRLRPNERAAVLLVKSYGYSYLEVAELLDLTEPAVGNLVHRAVRRLRAQLEDLS